MPLIKMKQVILFLVFGLSMSTLSFSQNYINLTKSKSRKNLEKFKLRYSDLNIIIQETDTTLSYLLRDTSVQNLDIVLSFDKNSKCYKEKFILTCDSCYQKFIANILSDKYYRWTKIDSSTYFARFPYRIICNKKTDKDFAFDIRRSDLAGEEYRKKIRQALNRN